MERWRAVDLVERWVLMSVALTAEKLAALSVPRSVVRTAAHWAAGSVDWMAVTTVVWLAAGLVACSGWPWAVLKAGSSVARTVVGSAAATVDHLAVPWAPQQVAERAAHLAGHSVACWGDTWVGN
jgi:hypothetical protein